MLTKGERKMTLEQRLAAWVQQAVANTLADQEQAVTELAARAIRRDALEALEALVNGAPAFATGELIAA